MMNINKKILLVLLIIITSICVGCDSNKDENFEYPEWTWDNYESDTSNYNDRYEIIDVVVKNNERNTNVIKPQFLTVYSDKYNIEETFMLKRNEGYWNLEEGDIIKCKLDKDTMELIELQ